MEEIIQQLAASGPMGVIAAGIVYGRRRKSYAQRRYTRRLLCG